VSKSRFSKFRHDIPKDKDSYVIGINTRSDGCQITDNVFEHRFGAFSELELKTELVHILLVAGKKGDTRDCIIARNRLVGDRLSYKTYGIWAGQNSDVVILDNIFENHTYSVAIDKGARVHMTSNKMSLDKPGSEYSSLLGEKASFDNMGIYSNSLNVYLYQNDIINYSRTIFWSSGRSCRAPPGLGAMSIFDETEIEKFWQGRRHR
jgi:hypothetical protein